MIVAAATRSVARRLRNYRAMHQLNQGKADAALSELDKPMPPVPQDVGKRRRAGHRARRRQEAERRGQAWPTAKHSVGRVAAGGKGRNPRWPGPSAAGHVAAYQGRRQGDGMRSQRQAKLRRARRQGRIDFVDARAEFDDLGAIAEDEQNMAEADRLYRKAVTCSKPIIRARRCFLNAKARLAGYLARSGQVAPPKRCSGRSSTRSRTPATCRRPSRMCCGHMSTCFSRRATTRRPSGNLRGDAADGAPGLAQTQAVLARELSGGTDEASRLFRQSVT